MPHENQEIRTLCSSPVPWSPSGWRRRWSDYSTRGGASSSSYKNHRPVHDFGLLPALAHHQLELDYLRLLNNPNAGGHGDDEGPDEPTRRGTMGLTAMPDACNVLPFL